MPRNRDTLPQSIVHCNRGADNPDRTSSRIHHNETQVKKLV
ncbi:hypothetical protein [Erwinia persicina]|nr:hypothetical protein [Erwinia persicina]